MAVCHDSPLITHHLQSKGVDMALWGGVFSEPTNDDLRKLNDSFGYDRRMYAQDITGSVAYARAMGRAGVLVDSEVAQIISGLAQVKAEFDAGKFVVGAEDEDIHTAVERRLVELIGESGLKLHTGRSRNDQVATDFRMWVKDAVRTTRGWVKALQAALVERAEQHAGDLMPGFTHMQPAQPVTAGHWLMSYFWQFQRDLDRLDDTYRRADVLPLGSGALAGTPFNLDRAQLAAELGFSRHSENSLDAVADRDFAADFLYALAMTGIHLSRLGEEIVLFSNPAFGFVTLADRYSTGSSLMPQKRNADPMELARGQAGRQVGHLMGLLTTLKGLPTGYNKDLQEDKEAVFGSFDTLGRLMPVAAAVIRTMTVHSDKMKSALVPEMLATDLADYLVKKGMPFRQALGARFRHPV
jgi:argininosuccinate lyase